MIFYLLHAHNARLRKTFNTSKFYQGNYEKAKENKNGDVSLFESVTAWFIILKCEI